MIRIHCPGCGLALEVDAGFAGGVCRCSECGTMMTVPDSRKARAERAARPDRPDSPLASPPPQSSKVAKAEPVRPDKSARPTKPAKPAEPAKPDASRSTRRRKPGGDDDADTSRKRAEAEGDPKRSKRRRKAVGKPTASGASEASKTSQAPPSTAGGEQPETGGARSRAAALHQRPSRRRLGVRVAIIAGFIVIFGGLAAAVIIGLIITSEQMESEAGPPVESPQQAAGPDDALPPPPGSLGANPFTMSEPNLIGIPAAGEPVVIVIEGSSNLRNVLPLLGELLRRNVATLPRPAVAQALVAGDGQVAAYPEGGPGAPSQWQAAVFDEWIAALDASGRADMRAAIDRALAARPERVLLIVAMPPPAAELEQWEARLAEANVRVDVVQIFRSTSDELRELAERFGGRYVQFAPARLQQWADQR